MANLTINEEQQLKIVSIIDKYLDLHKKVNKAYCINVDKMYDSNRQIVCTYDCNECREKHYSNIRTNILNSIGLGEYSNEKE